jgi:hypothetical protein
MLINEEKLPIAPFDIEIEAFARIRNSQFGQSFQKHGVTVDDPKIRRIVIRFVEGVRLTFL